MYTLVNDTRNKSIPNKKKQIVIRDGLYNLVNRNQKMKCGTSNVEGFTCGKLPRISQILI